MNTILERFEELHPTSLKLHQRALGVFPDGVTHDIRYFTPFPLYVKRAEGSHKWDVDGNEIIDYVMGHGALLLGHNHPEVQQAVARQLERGTHYGASHELEIEWAEKVTQLVPSAEVVRFTSSGTEATMMAIRLARAYTGRDTIVRFRHHFHGWNDNVVGEVNREDMHPHAFGVPDETLGNVVVVPQNDIVALSRTLGEDDVATVILEPTGAHWGTIPLKLELLPDIRDTAARAGTLLIFDEVVTGFRASPGGVQGLTGVTPDLTTLAKVLAGGLPGGAVTGRREVMSVIEFKDGGRADYEHRVPHPGTFNANPLSAAAGTTALGLVEEGSASRHADELCRGLVKGLNEALRGGSIPGCAYGFSSMFHLILGAECARPVDEFAWNWPDSPTSHMPRTPSDLAWTLRRGMLNEGIDLMETGGMVSSVHTERDVEQTIDAFARTVQQMKSEGLLDEN